MEFYLVRHTRVAVPRGTFYGHTDVELGGNLEEDFNRINRRLPKDGFVIYSSPSRRCMTLAEKFPETQIVADKRLMELNFGDWEMKTMEELQSREFDHWFQNFVDVACPNGESFRELYNRSVAAFDDICKKKQPKNVIIAHGGVVRALLSHILEFPLKNAFSLYIAFGSVTKIRIKPQKTEVLYINR